MPNSKFLSWSRPTHWTTIIASIPYQEDNLVYVVIDTPLISWTTASECESIPRRSAQHRPLPRPPSPTLVS